MKIILVLLDGLGDRSYDVLNNRTPLQAAETPNLDKLACLGSNGLFHPSFPGQCLPSETAHFLLFGYEIEKFPGRGLLEAVGEGVPFGDNDVLCLSHLSGIKWIDDLPILIHGRDDIKGSFDEIGELLLKIRPYEAEEISFKLHQTRRNDAIIVIKGPVSPFISDSDPILLGKTIARVQALLGNPETHEAEKTANALNRYLSYCHKKLLEHPLNRRRKQKGLPAANFLVTQRCGRRRALEPFNEHWGLKGMIIASTSVYIGLAHELGMTSLKVTDSDDPGRDLKERIRYALEDKDHDFIHVHTKVPDEAAHKGDPNNKMEVISSLDKGLDELLNIVEKGDDLLLAVTADHSTPSISPLIHSGEPVPVAILGPFVRKDMVTAFDEISGATGCLGLLRGPELMHMLLNYSDRSVLTGHNLGEKRHQYYPDNYEPFRLLKC